MLSLVMEHCFNRDHGTTTTWEVNVQQWKFPSGEVGIKLDVDSLHSTVANVRNITANITMTWESNDDVLALMQLVDALKIEGLININLHTDYFPYSRQDRRCSKGEGHSLKMTAVIINSLGFSRVYTKDAHSYVLESLVDNLVNIPQHVCAEELPAHDYLIAPDNGASKKILQVSAKVGGQIIIADKKRDSTGRIIESKINLSGVSAKDSLCVVDDLCDGGATFIELGKSIRTTLPNNKVNLYVTHGFFTKGVDELLKIYDNIFVHNLMNKSVVSFVKII